MAMFHCSSCNRETLNHDGHCAYCNAVLKFSLWKRKLRRHEAYGCLLMVLGASLLLTVKTIGFIILLAGLALIVQGLIRPRVQ